MLSIGSEGVEDGYEGEHNGGVDGYLKGRQMVMIARKRKGSN